MSERRMTGLGARHPGPEKALPDEILDREIEQALGVDPSPEFLARVRVRVSSDPAASQSKWYLLWPAAAAGVAATALVVAIYVGPAPPDTSAVPASAAPTVVATDSSSAPRQTADRGASATPDAASTIAERPARERPTAVPAATEREVLPRAFPEVLLSAAESRGFETLVGKVQRGELTITVDEQTAEGVARNELTDLFIAPITIRPLDSAGATEGAEE